MSEFHDCTTRRAGEMTIVSGSGQAVQTPSGRDLSLTTADPRIHGPVAEPLVLERRGAFFVNHGHGTRYGGGTITVDQMYVEYEIPLAAGRRTRPVVLLPGGCHTIAAYDETPDGREGWRTWFLRQGFPVYLAEWVGRGASGFDPSRIHQAREERDPDLLPRFLHLSHEEMWPIFRFGPEPGVAYPGLRFPIAAVEHYYAQLLPNTEGVLEEPELATTDGLIALLERIGPAVVIGHSRAGNAMLPAVIRRPELFAALVELEPIGCPYGEEDLPALVRVPFLSVFGDYLEGTIWQPFADECRALVARLEAAGGTARHIALAELGIVGNSHMLFMEDNAAEIAALVLDWLDRQGSAPRAT
jgi:pimeloyl-ACP methyl ester carboxylesterase